MKTLLLALPLVALSFAGCSKVDPLEGTPSRLLSAPGAADGRTAAAHAVPLHGRFVTVATPQASLPGQLQLQITGTGEVSHLGKAQFLDHATVGFTSSPPFHATGTSTVTAANGDQYFTTFTVTITPRPGSTQSDVRLRHTITGGTGRFSGATGSYVGTDVLDTTTPVGLLTIDGEIAY